jgi:two-component system sensor histidine kinase YesM
LVLRYSLLREQHIVKLEDEIVNIDNYLKLQKVRFSDRLSYSIEIDPDLRNLQMPKLTLQPLVENAIKHGISSSIKGGTIWVKARLVETGDVRVSIENDGKVLSGEIIENLNKMLQNDKKGTDDVGIYTIETDRGSGVGLKNVNERMKFYFGSSYSLSVHTYKNRTVFSFMIPPKILRL